jgi:hypothetical protein
MQAGPIPPGCRPRPQNRPAAPGRVTGAPEITMKIRTFLILLSCLVASAHAAQDFADGFESVPLARLFPANGNSVVIPSGTVGPELDWLIGELATGETTTEAEINEHFMPGYVATQTAAGLASFINILRSSYPDAYVAEVTTATPVRVGALLRTPANSNIGILQLTTRYADLQRISLIGVTGFSGNVQFVYDRTLTLQQAADKFTTFAPATGLLVARIDDQNRCQVIEGRNEDTLLATASIFKLWVLGGLARSIADGDTTAADPITLDAADFAPSGTINVEPLGTIFDAIDMARLMMGLSDNTATDHLHTHVGRGGIDAIIRAAGVANPEVLTPLLNINEQFRLFRTIELAAAFDFLADTEEGQEAFLPQLDGPLAGPDAPATTPFFHTQLLTLGTWRGTAMDICRTFAHLRGFRGEALEVVDAALGASAGQPNVRNAWDRVWYKGGSLAQAANQYNVWTHAWMLERNGEQPYVLVSMANSPDGGISGTNNVGVDDDVFDIQSINGRLLQLLSEL